MDPKTLKNEITKVTTRFYELIFNDPWFSKIFQGVDEEFLNNQQIDFMFGALGGENKYTGRNPKNAHTHIWVNDRIWDYRENLLKSVFEEMKTPEELRAAWLKVDEAFKAHIVNKGGPEECFGRYKTEPTIYFPHPDDIKKAS